MNAVRFLFILSIVLFPGLCKGQLLQVDGTRIVNSSNNQEVILNAVNFGNWMVMEGYLMNSVNEAPNQHTWKRKLTTLVGAASVKTFYDAWLTNHVTQSDINHLKAAGFNAVRLPLHYEYFVNLGTPDVWNEQGFALVDDIIKWCTLAGVYVILDLHAAPGGQSDNSGISDYDITKPSLWESAENRSKTVRLWDKISERYKNEPWVAGYDLINETNWNLPNGTLLRELFGSLTTAIRANGDNHILFIEGNGYSNDYTGLTPAWDPQMVYVFHKYNSSADFSTDLQWVLDLRVAQNRPIWCGEHGENSNDNFTKMVELLRGNGIGMSWWPMKKFESINCLSNATFPPGYRDLLNYLGGTNPTLNADTARTTLAQLAQSVLLANTRTQTEVLRAIFIQPNNRDTTPFGAVPSIPGRIYATDYDQGMNGYAYSDTGWENVLFTTGDYTAWNERWTYRNGGVDIDTCSDALSNGYQVGFFKPTEWMRYSVNVASPGTYTIALRVANGSGQTSTIQIQNGDGTKTLATASVPSGGWGNWTTISVTGGFSEAGVQAIRIANTGSSECDITSVLFTKTSDAIANSTSVPVSVVTVSLKANNGGYLSWQNASPFTLTCQAISETDQARFTLVDAGDGRTALLASNGRYVRYSASDNRLYADSDTIGLNQEFTLNQLNRSVAIKGANARYFSQNGNNPVVCDRTILASWEYFLMTTLSTTQGAPAAPRGVTYANGVVSWKSMVGALRYSVQRSTGIGASFVTIASDLVGTSFSDPNPVADVSNRYRVISHAGTFASAPSSQVSSGPTEPTPDPDLPLGDSHQDIGSVGIAGSVTTSNGTYTLKGSGADVWGNADGCSFVSQSLSGDFTITARLASMSNTDYWAKAGLMIRESNAANAKNVALLVTPEGGGTRMQWRSETGGNTSDHYMNGSKAPLWLRIARSGNSFTGWQSNDGVTWTNSFTVTPTMNSAVVVGLVVTSHNNNFLNTAVFDQVNVSGATAPATVTLGNLTTTYDGSAKSASAITVPAGLNVGFTYNGSTTSPTGAGSYAVVATVNDLNYHGSATGTLVIGKATGSVTLGNLAATYDGNAKFATATTVPAGLSVGLSYNGVVMDPTNLNSNPVWQASSSHGSGGNSASSYAIAKPTGLAVGDLMILSAAIEGGKTFTAPTATGTWTEVIRTANGGNLFLVVLRKIAVQADVDATSFSVGVGGGKYSIGLSRITGHSATNPIAASGGATGSGTAVASPAITTTAANQLVLSFHGVKKSAAFSASGSFGTEIYDVAGDPPSHAAYRYVQASAGSTGSKTATSSQSEAWVAIQVAVAGMVSPTIRDLGSYAVVGTIHDPNYQGTASGTLVIGKPTATVSLGNLTATYDGTAKAASVTTVPAGLSVSLTYNGSATAPTAAGSYAVMATVNDASYGGTASGTLVIGEAIAPTLAQVLASQYGLVGLDAGPFADPDSDGVPNLLEHAFGSSPVLPVSAPAASEFQIGPDSIRFSVIVRNDSGVILTPEISVNLATWNAAGITELVVSDVSQDGVPTGFTRRIWEIQGSMPRLFLRWQAEVDD